MTQVEQIQSDIKALPKQEFVALRDWLIELDWYQWDAEIEQDSASGKLDFLIEEALSAKANDTLTDL